MNKTLTVSPALSAASPEVTLTTVGMKPSSLPPRIRKPKPAEGWLVSRISLHRYGAWLPEKRRSKARCNRLYELGRARGDETASPLCTGTQYGTAVPETAAGSVWCSLLYGATWKRGEPVPSPLCTGTQYGTGAQGGVAGGSWLLETGDAVPA